MADHTKNQKNLKAALSFLNARPKIIKIQDILKPPFQVSQIPLETKIQNKTIAIDREIPKQMIMQQYKHVPLVKQYPTKIQIQRQIKPVSHFNQQQSECQQNSYSTNTRFYNPQPISKIDKANKIVQRFSSGSDVVKKCSAITKYQIGDFDAWANLKTVPDHKLYSILNTKFKIKEFRHNQKAIIKCSLLKNDVFVCMPTGGGKSLTFQICAAMQPGLTICIMPLISLIFDQESQCQKLKIQAFSFTGGISANDYNRVMSAIQDMENNRQGMIIFTTPEKITRGHRFLQEMSKLYKKDLLKRIVIDEVHCVSTWGRDFRKEYENLGILKTQFPTVPLLALTATATDQVRSDVISKLHIQNCYYFQSLFNRPNLYYEVRKKDKHLLQQIIKICHEYQNQSGIIYCFTKKDCQELNKKLKENNLKVAYYHSEIDQIQKQYVQENWMKNKIQVIIATIAFGMGINKPDVRFVIHQTMSKSLENYYQQSGRAGRDGQPAKCILFYKRSDRFSFNYMNLKNEYSTLQSKDFSNKQILDMVKYAQELYQCRRKFTLKYFGEDFDQKQCNKTCDNCKLQRQWVERECCKEMKVLLNFLIVLRDNDEHLTSVQLIQICKGKKNKQLQQKYKFYAKKKIDLSELTIFSDWKDDEIQYLLIELIGLDLLYEKTEEYKMHKKSFTCVYLKCHPNPAKVFIRQMQTYKVRMVKKSSKTVKPKQTAASDSGGQQIQDEIPEFDKYLYKPSKKSSECSMNDQDQQELFELLEQRDRQQQEQRQRLQQLNKQQGQQQRYKQLLAFLQQLNQE